MSPDNGSDARAIGLRWVRANVASACIAALASLAIYGVRNAIGAAEVGAVAVQYAAVVILSPLSGAADGFLTGSVLQRLLPRLPVRAWIGVHAAIALVVGLGGEMSVASPPISQTETSSPELILMGCFMGAVLGAINGSIEALVMRGAARETKMWVVFTIFAFAFGIGFLALPIARWDVGVGFAAALADIAMSFVLSIVVALLMLPAVHHLRPRDPDSRAT